MKSISIVSSLVLATMMAAALAGCNNNDRKISAPAKETAKEQPALATKPVAKPEPALVLTVTGDVKSAIGSDKLMLAEGKIVDKDVIARLDPATVRCSLIAKPKRTDEARNTLVRDYSVKVKPKASQGEGTEAKHKRVQYTGEGDIILLQCKKTADSEISLAEVNAAVENSLSLAFVVPAAE